MDATMMNHNLFAALRAAFPADLDGVAIETDNDLNYSWRDLDRATAMLANLLGERGEEIPAGSLILSGAITEAVMVKAGDNVSLQMQGMGSVNVRFN